MVSLKRASAFQETDFGLPQLCLFYILFNFSNLGSSFSAFYTHWACFAGVGRLARMESRGESIRAGTKSKQSVGARSEHDEQEA
mgnify:CR=1 FL=1